MLSRSITITVFSYRLDLDVDGSENDFRIDRLVAKEPPEDHPRRSLWTVEGATAKNEAEAQLDVDFKRPALWRDVWDVSTRVGVLGYLRTATAGADPVTTSRGAQRPPQRFPGKAITSPWGRSIRAAIPPIIRADRKYMVQ